MYRTALKSILILAVQAAALAQEKGAAETPGGPKDFTELVARYGPYAFAVLSGFAVVWMLKQARDAAASDNKNVRALVKTFRWLAVAAGVTCLGFAIIGSHHWLETEASAHVFHGVIKDLKSYESIDADSDGFYFKTEFRRMLPGETEQLRNEHFVIIQAAPFSKGQSFVVDYKKDTSPRSPLTIRYDGKSSAAYSIQYTPPSTFEMKQLAAMETAPNPFVANAQVRPPVDLKLVQLLQDPHTNVGAKIELLDKLGHLDAAALKAYAATLANGELFALTLFDLSRHSDAELAYKARALVDKSGAEAVTASLLSSSKPDMAKAAEKTLFRVSRERAERILKQAARSSRMSALAAQVARGDKQQVLTPIGSHDGDLYFVRAGWNSKDQKITACLNRKIGDRLLGQKLPKVEFRTGSQTVSVPSKELVLKLAEDIAGCQAKATFPDPQTKKF